jgi:hypothetical protein
VFSLEAIIEKNRLHVTSEVLTSVATLSSCVFRDVFRLGLIFFFLLPKTYHTPLFFQFYLYITPQQHTTKMQLLPSFFFALFATSTYAVSDNTEEASQDLLAHARFLPAELRQMIADSQAHFHAEALLEQQLQGIINRHDSGEMYKLIQAHQPLSQALQQRLLTEARAALQRESGYALFKESIVSQLMIMDTTATSEEGNI